MTLDAALLDDLARCYVEVALREIFEQEKTPVRGQRQPAFEDDENGEFTSA